MNGGYFAASEACLASDPSQSTVWRLPVRVPLATFAIAAFLPLIVLRELGSSVNTSRPVRSYRPKATRNADAQKVRDGISRPSGTAAGTRQPQWPTISLMPMKVREVIRLLEKHGWVEMRSRGSHRHFKHPDEAFVITVPGNDGKELAPGTLNVILKKAGLK